MGASFNVNRVVLVVLMILFGAAIGGGLFTFNAEAIQPGKQKALEQLGELGPTPVHLGEQGSAKKQFKSLVVFNMMSAANCHLVENLQRAVAKDDNVSKSGVQWIGKAGWTDIRSNENGPRFAGAYPGTEPLENTEYDPQCKGRSSLIYEAGKFKDRASSNIPVVGKLIGYQEKLLPQNGNDMEGLQGKKGFIIHDTFTVSGDTVLLAYEQQFKVSIIEVPVFLRRQYKNSYSSVLLPDGIDGSEFRDTLDRYGYKNEQGTDYEPHQWFEEDGGGSGYGIGSGYRVVTNAPLLVENSHKLGAKRYHTRDKPSKLSNGVDETKTKVFGGDGKVSLHNLMENSKFLYCKEARGYVQSNAGSYNDDGEAGGTPPQEDRVFPIVQITENRTECFDFPLASNDEVIWRTFVRDADSHDKKYCTGSEVESGATKQIKMGAEKSFDASCKYEERSAKFESLDGTQQVYIPVMTFPDDRCSEKTYDITQHYSLKTSGKARIVQDSEPPEVYLSYNEGRGNAKFSYSLLKYKDSSDIEIRFDKNESGNKYYGVKVSFYDSRGNKISDDGQTIHIEPKGPPGGAITDLKLNTNREKRFRRLNIDISGVRVNRGEDSSIKFLGGDEDWRGPITINEDLREAESFEVQIYKHRVGGENAVLEGVKVEGKPRGC